MKGYFMNLSDKIRKARKKSKLTQEDLALKLNISRKTLSGWENGRSSPDLEMTKKLSIYLNKNIDYFFDEPQSIKKKKQMHITKIINIMNATITLLNLILILFTKFNVVGLTIIEIIIIIFIIHLNHKMKISTKIPYKYISLILIFILLFILSLYHSIEVLGHFYWGGMVGSLIRSFTMTVSTYLILISFHQKTL